MKKPTEKNKKLSRAEELANDVLKSYPRQWKGKRIWAKERLINIIEEYLKEYPGDEELALDAAGEWMVESYANRN